MKKNPILRSIFSASLALFITAAYTGCAKNEFAEKSPLLEHISKLSATKPGDDLSSFYSKTTLSAAHTFSSQNNGTDILSGLDRKLFVKGSSFDITSETRNGNRAEIVFHITKHPSPNMIGYESAMTLVFEDSVWKIDKSSQIPTLSHAKYEVKYKEKLLTGNRYNSFVWECHQIAFLIS
jgi:hypothetical protein